MVLTLPGLLYTCPVESIEERGSHPLIDEKPATQGLFLSARFICRLPACPDRTIPPQAWSLTYSEQLPGLASVLSRPFGPSPFNL